MKFSLANTLILVFLVLSSLHTNQLYAQWNTNTSVNLQISGLVTADMQTVPTTDGKLWVAFYHENSGNYDMRAQLFDAAGNKLLGADGVLISNQTSGTATYVFNACVDGSDNLIVGMQDQRSGDMQAVLYKISQAGTHLWNPAGIILGNGLAPWPCTLTNGEVAVCWNEGISNTLNLQKITTGGALAWATPIAVVVSGSNTTRGQIVANLNGKFTMVYQKNAGGISTTLYAQQFNNTGTALYSPLQICNQTTAGYRYYSIKAEADTTYFGYYSSSGFRFNSFLQRINPNGTIPWGMNGSNFNTSTSGSDNYQMETRINLKPGSPYVWSVCSFSDPNQEVYGVYVQKFLKTSGARQFTDQGKVVYPINASRNTQAGDLSLVDDTPMFMAYDNTYKIYATRLDASGNFLWPHTRVEISSTTSVLGKGRYGFGEVGNDRCAGVWTENRGSGNMGYAQGISIGGLLGIDVATQGGVPAVITTGGGTLQMTSVILPSNANQAVTWSIVAGTGNATISATGLVSGLSDGNVWAKATAVQDVTVKDSMMITLSGQVPVAPSVVTLPATNIDLNVATLNGTVNANHFSSSATFEWGLTSSYGNTINGTPSTITGNTTTAVLAGLSGLLPGTTYHFRCVGTNAAGITNGEDLMFTTLCQLAGTIGSISGTGIVCAGSTGNVYSVAPFANATSYIWSLPYGATVTSGNNTNAITVSYGPAAQSGNITVYATDGICISTLSDALPVTVNNLPEPAGAINGNQIVCAGESGVTYTVAAIPGATGYTWSLPVGAAIVSGANSNSIVVDFSAGAVSGPISVFGTNTCGSGTASNSLLIEIVPLPGTISTITGLTDVCAPANGISYSVTAVTNAYGYIWSLPAGAAIVSGANTNQITVNYSAGAVSGNISVYGTNGNCLGEPSVPLAVTVNPTPAMPVITRHGDTLTSSSNTGNQWYLDGVAIPGATGEQHVAVYSGYYSVVATINGCSSAVSASMLVLPVSVTSIPFEQSINLFPNPGNGLFGIVTSSAKEEIVTIEIVDSQGAIISKRENVLISSNNPLNMDIQNSPMGSYLVLIRYQNNLLMKKYLKSK